jgi:hypothetical protein
MLRQLVLVSFTLASVLQLDVGQEGASFALELNGTLLAKNGTSTDGMSSFLGPLLEVKAQRSTSSGIDSLGEFNSTTVYLASVDSPQKAIVKTVFKSYTGQDIIAFEEVFLKPVPTPSLNATCVPTLEFPSFSVEGSLLNSPFVEFAGTTIGAMGPKLTNEELTILFLWLSSFLRSAISKQPLRAHYRLAGRMASTLKPHCL